jgi:hypothetical protein
MERLFYYFQWILLMILEKGASMMFVQRGIGLVQMIRFKNWRRFLLCLVAVMMTSATTQALATTLLSESFDLGSHGLSGYGWTADTNSGRTATAMTNPGSWAGTGWGVQASTATGVEHWRRGYTTARPANTTSITATAGTYVQWSGSTQAARGDNGFGFHSNGGAWTAGLFYDGTNGATGGWKLSATGGGTTLMFPAVYNGTSSGVEVTSIELTLDLENDELTGTVSNPAGSPYGGTSTKIISTGGPGSAAVFADLIFYHADLVNSSATGGMDLDDIVVTAVVGIPEPASLGLLGIAGSLMLLRRRRA